MVPSSKFNYFKAIFFALIKSVKITKIGKELRLKINEKSYFPEN